MSFPSEMEGFIYFIVTPSSQPVQGEIFDS